MEKQIIVCASPHLHKYFFEPTFEDMPVAIKEELTEAVAAIAEKVNTVISVGFDAKGLLFIEQNEENGVFGDDIGAELEIKKFRKEKAELLKSIQMWYMIYRTKQGQLVKEVVMYQAQGMDKLAIFEKIEDEYSLEDRLFVEALLEE